MSRPSLQALFMQGSAARRFGRNVAILSVCLVALLPALSGCGNEATMPVRRQNGGAAQQQLHGQLFDNAIANFNQLEHYAPEEILAQSVDRLNDWVAGRKPQVAWQRDPLLEQLPEELGQTSAVRALDEMRYSARDAAYLRRTVWMRDVSKRVGSGAFDDLEIAARLFDWVVRNVQTDPEPGLEVLQPIRFLPDEVLLFGRGRSVEKSWIFLLLARQQHLDAVMLALPDPSAAGGYREWLPAVHHDGELYLFDMSLGLPIPKPAEHPAFRLPDLQIATLREAREQSEVLGQLSLDSYSYPVSAEDLQQVTALIPAGDQSLSKRMLAIEENLAGEDRLALTLDAHALAERLTAGGQVAEARLWERPFRVVAERESPISPPSLEVVRRRMRPLELSVPELAVNPLWSGRLLHFRGDFDGKAGARRQYLLARETVQNVDPGQLTQDDLELRPFLRLTATLWLGQISFDAGQFEVARDFFGNRLLFLYPANPWQPAALYNLARVEEELDNRPRAILLYEQAPAPIRHGSLLRAKWLLAELDESQRSEAEQLLEELRAAREAQRPDARPLSDSEPPPRE